MIEQYVGMKDTPGVYVGSVRCGFKKMWPIYDLYFPCQAGGLIKHHPTLCTIPP